VCMASADVGDGITAGLDADGAVAAGGAHEFLMVQPVWCAIQWLTATVANTIVRWASMDRRLWW
jgi:hypothetical protein